MVLMLAERSWALAMQLKNDVENYRAKFHANRKLIKAGKWAQKLVALCNAVADERTKLEAESYSSWYEGNILMEHKQWALARQHLIKSKTVYEELGKVGTAEQQERCQERVSEIEPAIRYCKFSMEGQDQTELVHLKTEATDTGRNLDFLKSQLDVVLSEIRKKEVETLNEVLWKGSKVPIKNEAIRISFLNADSIAKFEIPQATTEEQKLQLYDKIFIHYNDALKSIGNEVSNAKTQKKSAQEISQLEDLKDFITYSKLQKTMDRNYMILESLEAKIANDAQAMGNKADEVVRLYEILIENITEINNLKEATDEKTNKIFAAKLLTFKALRCYYLGQTYEKIAKWAEAFALYERAIRQIDEAVDHHKECEPIDINTVDKLNTTAKKTYASKARVKAIMFQESIKQAKSPRADQSNEQKVLLENLNSFDPGFLESGKLMEFPPNFELMTCKPVLFDLAEQNFAFPNLAERKKAPRTGLFARWWG
eukprot:TRINITY_DN248_c0_g1_i1.p1 TRINITY_DN248_c0_g1~~TRINITY_DN248_c0_g1_i1.p1  ORF type:complete len:566 (-),score=145.48 TRINITY_DN248_c0_g1_i1:107-1558(-)